MMYKIECFCLFVLLNLYSVNTIFGQNVASDKKFFLNWDKNNVKNEFPRCLNYDISYSILNNFKLPSVNHSFYTPYKNNVQIKNVVTEVLNLPKNPLEKFKNELKNDLVYTYHHTLEGTKGVLVLNFCPYVLKNGQIHKVLSFDLELIPTSEIISNPVLNKKRRLINSVFSSGECFKFNIYEDGFYKIDAST